MYDRPKQDTPSPLLIPALRPAVDGGGGVCIPQSTPAGDANRGRETDGSSTKETVSGEPQKVKKEGGGSRSGLGPIIQNGNVCFILKCSERFRQGSASEDRPPSFLKCSQDRMKEIGPAVIFRVGRAPPS